MADNNVYFQKISQKFDNMSVERKSELLSPPLSKLEATKIPGGPCYRLLEEAPITAREYAKVNGKFV